MKSKQMLWRLFLLAVTAPQLAAAANVADFSDFSLTSGSSVLLPGRLFIPPEAAGAVPRPFILFLHGSGENGTDNISQIEVDLDNLLAEAKRRGAFLYAPQTANNWSDFSVTQNVMTMIDRAVADQNVDNLRLYVTGLSSGGGGTWNMLNRYPDRFAAGIPICGVSPASDFVPSRLVDQAIYAFHARDDGVVPVGTSRAVIDSILTAAHASLPTYPPPGGPTLVFPAVGPDLTYVEYATGGHVIWEQVYTAPGVKNWLFAHTNAVPEPTAVSMTSAVVIFGIFSVRRQRHGWATLTAVRSFHAGRSA